MGRERVAIVGAGIVGLAHAWSAAERGHEVSVFERSTLSSGASIRNFGMIWPIGQPEASISIALKSRQRWLTLAEEAKIWVNPYGSLHLAHRPDEWAVLQEYCELQRSTLLRDHVSLLNRESALQRSAGINPDGFLGALYSDLELCVNPTEAVRTLPRWLSDKFGIEFHFDRGVTEVSTGRLRTAFGQTESFDRIIICSGHDLETLYPSVFRALPIQKCKLRMLRTVPQPSLWQLGTHLASGLTLRHYNSFRCCASLEPLARRIAAEAPELDQLGIHVMASQDNYGRIVLGDSHEYGPNPEPFDSERIERLILRELRKIIHLPDWSIDSRWHGVYAKVPNAISVVQSPEAGVFFCTGLGGAGMTMSFGIAEDNWQTWSGFK